MEVPVSQMDTGYLSVDSSIVISGWQDHNYAMVTATLEEGDRNRVLGRGAARRSSGDKHRPEIAQQLAVGRALEDAGRRIQKRANGMVRHYDSIAEHKRLLREQPFSPLSAFDRFMASLQQPKRK